MKEGTGEKQLKEEAEEEEGTRCDEGDGGGIKNKEGLCRPPQGQRCGI